MNSLKLFVYFIGNKCDLEQLREVKKEEATAMVKQYNMMQCLETSAKDNTNIDEVFFKMAKVGLVSWLHGFHDCQSTD